MVDFHLDGENLAVETVFQAAQAWQTPQEFTIHITPEAVTRVNRARAAVEKFIARNDVIYGITTGFGDFKDQIIPLDKVQLLQANIVASHATGVGPLLTPAVVRAMMIVRVQTFLKGHSGVRLEVIQTLLAMINRGVYPLVPSQGSLGASGDLAPLAHVALVLIGAGEALYKGETLPGAEAMRRAGIPTVRLEAKEGLALTNGTALISSFGALTVYKANLIAESADIIAALSIEALGGTPMAFDPRLHNARPHPGQVASAARLRALLEGSRLVRGYDPLDIQDAYSLRCTPQVHGAARQTIEIARQALEIELNSANDNPLIFFDDAGEAVCISGGNFHGEPLAIPLDHLKVGLCEFASISERRMTRLIDHKTNKDILPPFLTRAGGLNSGFMLVQYTSAALVSENKVLAHPASVDTIPSSANTEDHVSMGTIAARQAFEIANNVENVLACELFSAAQGIDFRMESHPGGTCGPECLGRGTLAAYQLVRSRVPFIASDTIMYPHLNTVRALIASGELLAVVRQALS